MALVRTDYGLIYNTDGSLCATLLPDDGVAVTEGTENLVNNPTEWMVGASPSHQVVEDTGERYLGCKISKTTKIASSNPTSQLRAISIADGETYTASIYQKCLFNAGEDFAGRLIFYDAAASNTLASVETEKIGEWERLKITYTNNTGATLNDVRVFYYPAKTQGSITLTAAPQVEKKPFDTPFVEGTRPAGILPYPADIINLDHTTWMFEWEPWQNLDSMTGIAKYPKILSVGEYFVNNSFVLWYYGGVIRLYIKGSTNTNWSKFSDWTPPQDWYKQGKKYKFALQLTNRDTIKVYLDGIKIIETTISDPFTGIANNRWWIGNNTLFSFANAVFRNMRIINNRHTSEDEIKTWHSLGAPFYDPREQIDAGARPIYAPGVQIDSTGAWGISNGVKQAGFGTDGRWVAGGGKVVSDAQGLRTYNKPYTDPTAVKQIEIGTDGALIFGGGAGRADSEGMILYDISDPANPKPMIRFIGKTGSADFEGVVKAKTLVIPVGTNRWG